MRLSREDKMKLPIINLIIIGFTMLVSYSYFYQAGGWNQNSRLDLVRAIIEEQRLQIDSFHENTGDKSKVGEHYYSDKAPGQPFLAVPFVLVTKTILQFIDIEPESNTGLVAQAYAATFFTSIIPTILSAFLLLWLGLKMGFSYEANIFMVLVFAFGSPAWCYATLFFPHALAACALLLSFCTVVAQVDADSKKKSFFLSLLTGLFAGFSVLVEYHVGPAAVIIAIFLLIQIRIAKPHYIKSATIGIFLGALICMCCLMLYNYFAFGSALTLSYQVKIGFDEMQDGLFGVTYPRWNSLWELLFGQYRGLLPLAPVLGGAVFGYGLLLYYKSNRLIGSIALIISLFFILIHASFINWHGGWAYGPRYMLVALPFFCLPLALLWMNVNRIVRSVLLALAIVGSIQSFVAVSVTPQAPKFYLFPFKDLYWPAFQHGEFALNHQTYEDFVAEYPFLRHPEYGRFNKRAAWNFGEKLGLSGHASMFPLYSFWVLISLILYCRRKDRLKI